MKRFLPIDRIRNGLLKTICGAICLAAFLAAAGTDSRNATQPPPTTESGTASFYADKYHGKPTASGEIFDMHQLTAAHPRLPFGTIVKVTNTQNNRSVLVRINDRGPFVPGRVIDLSLAAAEELRMVKSGLAEVKLEVVR
jgi:rare lipoprotein A